jgi:hypothetical protein
VASAQNDVTLLKGVGTATFESKAVGVAIGQCFRDRIQTEQVQCLHGPIPHRGDPEWTALAVAFGNVHPAERLRLITVPSQRAESLRFRLRCVPDLSVHTRSFRTRITDNAQDGQSPASKRVGEQVNQGLDFIPPALPDSLHDTRLEPTNRAIDFRPVDDAPVDRAVRGRTSKRCRRRHICFAPLVSWPGFLVTDDPREVSPLSREGMSDPWEGAHPLSAPLQSGLRLLPHPLPTVPSAHLTACFPLRGDNGITSFIWLITGGLGRASGPVAHHPRQGNAEAPMPGHVPFWFRPNSIFGLSNITAFNGTSPGLTLPRTAGPRPR